MAYAATASKNCGPQEHVADDLVLRKLINQIIDDLQVAGIET